MERGFVSKHFAESEPLSWIKKNRQQETDTSIYRLLVETSEFALIIQASLRPLFCNFSVVCIFLPYKGTCQLTTGNFDYTALISWVNHAWTKQLFLEWGEKVKVVFLPFTITSESSLYVWRNENLLKCLTQTVVIKVEWLWNPLHSFVC